VNGPADDAGSGETGPYGLRRSSDIDRQYLHIANWRGHRHHMRYYTNAGSFGGSFGGGGPGRRPADAELRASDAERNEVADRLSRHYADGRLDATEFKERLDHAMGAKTRGDLSGLFDDLPRLRPEAPPEQIRRRRRIIPALLLLGCLFVGASITFSVVPVLRGVHFGWIFLILVALYFWTHAGRRIRRHRDAEVEGWR